MTASKPGRRVLIENALLAAGVRDDPANVAWALREAGVYVSRDSRGRWFADKQHHATQEWLADLAGGDASAVREVMRRIDAEQQAAARASGPPGRGTGRHIFPEAVRYGS